MSTIVLGVTGSIAAYKAADLASQLVKSGHDVYSVMTGGAAQFISPTTFHALTSHPCPTSMWDEPFPGEIAHIFLAGVADLFIVAPASMDFLAKLAQGLAGDMLAASIMATKAPVILAPGMNTNMWENSATQHNLKTLAQRGYLFVDPVSGRLACRTVGVGKMADIAVLMKAIEDHLNHGRRWQGKKVLVTAGPTREPIDAVRYITNRSSGKMGYAIAEAAALQGAEVTLVSGPVSIPVPLGVKLVSVQSAEEMHRAVIEVFPAADVVFAAAAVADYRPIEAAPGKIKKGDTEIALSLTRTVDILAELGRAKSNGQLLIGFAAETHDVEANALAKLDTKKLDFIVANDVSRAGAGFDVDHNEVSVYSRQGDQVHIALSTKRDVAVQLLDIVYGAVCGKTNC